MSGQVWIELYVDPCDAALAPMGDGGVGTPIIHTGSGSAGAIDVNIAGARSA